MKRNHPTPELVRNDYLQGCSVEIALRIMGGKWKGLILFALLDGAKRFGELRRIIPGVTQRMLTLQLKELEECGIVRRDVYPGKILRVEYALTELGETVKPVILAISSWGSTYKQAVSALKEG